MNITEFKYRYDSNAKDALVLYRYISKFVVFLFNYVSISNYQNSLP
jgi:hypothetical protein